MNFSARSIVSIVLILGSIIVGYFVMFPRWTAYTQAKAALSVQQDQQTNLKLAQSQLNSFLAQYKQHTQDAATLNQALPLSQDQLYNVLNDLDTLSKQSGMTIGTLSVVDSAQADQLGASANAIQPVNLDFTTSGTYPAFKNFLTTLESNLRIIDVNSLNLSSSDSGNMTFDLKFTTYYEK
jgi:Tfp pilus assembly protein PilO